MKDISAFAADLLMAVQLSLGQVPIDPPRAIAITPEKLHEMVCPNPSAKSCRVAAWYAPEGTVYIDETLDIEGNLFARSILVHELVHHVQRMTSGHNAKDCVDWRRREHEAYAVQIRWLRSVGWNARSLRGQFPFVHCN